MGRLLGRGRLVGGNGERLDLKEGVAGMEGRLSWQRERGN